MNDRAQGGSTVNGPIELMQNRRLITDDNKGLPLTDILNETDSKGNGLKSNALYWV